MNPSCYAVEGLSYLHCPKAPLDHFQCYSGAFPMFQKRSVTLQDQFERKDTTVVKPETFCNPVSKGDSAIFDLGAHLKCYTIKDTTTKPAQARFVSRTVKVKNQFGLRDLKVTSVATVCLPTQKDDLAAPLALDHFKCYKASGEKPSLSVILTDQFGTEQAAVVKPVSLCNPVAKTVQGSTIPIGDPTAHLVCYQIKAPRFTARTVTAKDQFGTESVKVKKPVTLCVPSEKIESPEVDQFPTSKGQITIHWPDGTDEQVPVSGPTTVKVDVSALGDTDRDRLEQVPTEIVNMMLVGDTKFGPIVVGVRDPARSPFRPSVGEIEESKNKTRKTLDLPPFTPAGSATSFFDVFFEVKFPDLGLRLHNDGDHPLHMDSLITHKPPAADETYQRQSSTPIVLFDENENAIPVTIGACEHTPNPSAGTGQ
jgi:hypothetical protein